MLAPESEIVCAHYQIPTVEYRVASTIQEASKRAEELGFPVVIKIISPQIIHKTEAGGVMVGIRDQDDLRRSFEKVMSNARHYSPNADIIGVFIQRVVQPGIEVMVGALRDPQFGPSVSFGLGGIFTEIFKDVVFGIAPLDEAEAYRMIRSIKAYSLLTGYRNLPKADEKSIVDIILKTSKLISENPEIDQIDFNPIVVTDKESIVLDTRIFLR